MLKSEFIAWAKGRGWVEDKWGHLHRMRENHEYRFKISSISVRYEVKVHHEATGSNEWLRLASGYLKDLSISPENKINGLKRRV